MESELLSVSPEKNVKIRHHKRTVKLFYVLIPFRRFYSFVDMNDYSLTAISFFSSQTPSAAGGTGRFSLSFDLFFLSFFFHIAFLFVSSPFPLMAVLIVALSSAHAAKGMMTPVKSDMRPDKPVSSRRQSQQMGEERVGSRGRLAEARVITP